MSEERIEKYVWKINGDKPCNACAELNDSEFKSLDDVPDKPHPNCSCCVNPIYCEEGECDCEDTYDDLDEAIGDADSAKEEAETILEKLKDFVDSDILDPVKEGVSDIIDSLDQSIGAFEDFLSNYRDMKDANTIGADKYFHAKANCEAAQRGEVGEATAKVISEVREFTDFYKQMLLDGDSAIESAKKNMEDLEANEEGRDKGRENPDEDCSDLLQNRIPKGLDKKYW